VVDAYVAVYQRVVPDSPFDLEPLRHVFDAYHVLLTKPADGIRQVGEFGEPEQWRFDDVLRHGGAQRGTNQHYLRGDRDVTHEPAGGRSHVPARNV
jgi:hypothetical protein